jgi:UDP-N-acetylmuramoyl-L-alanyl-D-glutamate--2,6-diaminopimelate ligase
MIASPIVTPQKISLAQLLPECAFDFAHIDVEGLQLDSRAVNKGDVFLALPGIHVDGRFYIDSAIAQGAAAVLVESKNEIEKITLHQQTPIIPVKSLTKKISAIAGDFYKNPSAHLSVIGVTGTNGKTTTTQFIAQALSLMNVTCGVMGTVGVGLPDALAPLSQTTPNAIDVQRYLAQLLQEGAKAVAMEVSSHGLDQHRVDGVQFHTALFTNLSRDHLDYHLTMEAYGQAKEKLFLHTELQRAVINFDDEFGLALATRIAPHIPTYTYSVLSSKADIYAKNTLFDERGIRATVVTPWGEGELISPLLGEFNLSNLLGVLSVLCSYGYELNQGLDVLSKLTSVVGRMQRLGGKDAQPLIIVDYAHTPDALRNVLTTLRDHCAGKLWCVFGCGGDRDMGKRSLMGSMSESYADVIIITDDNPRFEKSDKIISQILDGIKNKQDVVVKGNRAEAIAYAVACADVNDVVLIAGKGHEQYQEVSGIKTPFSDVIHAQAALEKRGTKK